MNQRLTYFGKQTRFFQFTSVTETGLSGYHRVITTFRKPHFSRIKLKIIHYPNFKRFDEQKFIADVKNGDFLLKQMILIQIIQLYSPFLSQWRSMSHL